MAETFFLTKTVVDPSRMISIGGVAALEQHEALRTFLVARVGREAADLFAEPIVSRGNGAADTTISWYATVSGNAARLADLPLDARNEVEARLKRNLAAVAEGLADPDFGPLLGAALMLDGPNDIWIADRQPLLINWGLAPVEAQQTNTARDRHYAATLGRLLPLAAAPALSREEWLTRGYDQPAAPSATPGTSAASGAAVPPGVAAASAGTRAAPGAQPRNAAPGEAAPSSAAPPDSDPQRRSASTGSARAGGIAAAPAAPAAVVVGTERNTWRWRWIAPIALLVLFTLVLIWLLLPGMLLYPQRQVASVIEDGSVAEAAREANRALEERIAQLHEAVDGAVCTPEGDLLLPGGFTPDGRAPRGSGADGGARADGAADGAAPAGPITMRPDALVPPPPSQLVQPSVEGATPVSLLSLLESGTAIVLATGGGGSGHGTGFFVTPDLLVTNHHVVAPALIGGRVLVTSESLGEVKPAELLASRGPMESTGGDFALLRVTGATAPPLAIRLPQEPLKLQQVIAAGYPGFVLETDQGFRALVEGDARAAPGLVVTDGIVNAQQRLGATTEVVVHTAHISPGNSGGPLVDGCGRVVGINTFIRNDQVSLNSLNFALSSADLIGFLHEHGVEVTASEARCEPQVAAGRRPPPALAPDAPAADAPAPDGAAADAPAPDPAVPGDAAPPAGD